MILRVSRLGRMTLALAALSAGAASCSGPQTASVVALEGDSSKPVALSLSSLTGARDGGRLRARVVFEGEAGRLLLDLEFQLGVPTRLAAGTYEAEISGGQERGEVVSTSVTFLGGQSDQPNLGGVFKLLSETGSERYRVRLPTSTVERPDRP